MAAWLGGDRKLDEMKTIGVCPCAHLTVGWEKAQEWHFERIDEHKHWVCTWSQTTVATSVAVKKYRNNKSLQRKTITRRSLTCQPNNIPHPTLQMVSIIRLAPICFLIANHDCHPPSVACCDLQHWAPSKMGYSDICASLFTIAKRVQFWDETLGLSVIQHHSDHIAIIWWPEPWQEPAYPC